MDTPKSRYIPGQHNVECQYTGFKIKSGDMARDYNGVYGRKQSIDRFRHPQEFAPSTVESKVPEVSYPKSYDNFVEVTFIADP